MQVSVIIVSYNVRHFLEQCLYALTRATAGIQAEILVVDNASADGSTRYLQPRFPTVIFIENARNTGFAKANNQALGRATGRYILFLNPDTIVAEDSLSKCLQLMETQPATGACGVRMLDGSGRFLPESRRGFPSLQASFYRLSGLAALFPRSQRFARYYMGHLEEKTSHEVEVLAGAFLFVRKAVLDTTGGFDERFFMYGEDIDLSYRIRQAGYKNYYLADTAIIHFKGESTKKDQLQHIRHFYGAMEIFTRKYNHPARAGMLCLFIQVYTRLRLLLAAGRNGRKPKGAAPPSSLRTLLAGDRHSTGEAHSIIGKYTRPVRNTRIAAADANLLEEVAGHDINEIVFCQGDLSFSKIIAWMQLLPATVSFRIHAAGSGSIAGSGDKNSTGEVLS